MAGRPAKKIHVSKRSLTDRERFALDWQAHYQSDNWQLIYTMSREKQPKCNNNTMISATSVWKNTDIVKDYYEKALLREKIAKQAAIDSYINTHGIGAKTTPDIEREILERMKARNLDNDGIITELNNLLRSNELESEKKATILLKLGDFQRKTDANDENAKIHRFYTPLRCQECEIYKQAKAQCNEVQPVK